MSLSICFSRSGSLIRELRVKDELRSVGDREEEPRKTYVTDTEYGEDLESKREE